MKVAERVGFEPTHALRRLADFESQIRRYYTLKYSNFADSLRSHIRTDYATSTITMISFFYYNTIDPPV